MSRRNIARRGFFFYLLSTLSVALQFFFYLLNSSQLELMDFSGMLFFISAVISHASLIVLIPFCLLFLPISLISGKESFASIVFFVCSILLNAFFFINGCVFSLYRFHINGMVLGMYFGEGGDEIFQFDTVLYLKFICVLLVIVAINVAFKFIANKMADRFQKIRVVFLALTLLFLAIFSNLFYAYSTVAQKQSVVRSAAYVPYYFPLTATRLMIKMGAVSQDDLLKVDFGKQSGLMYPLKKIEEMKDPINRKNIIIIAIDSWNYRSFNPIAMPNVAKFASKNIQYSNHLSSNGTRGSIFGMFFGVSSYYWKDFEVTGTSPILIDELIKEKYEIKAFASATLKDPNFAKLIFGKVPSINVSTKGSTCFDRDCQIVHDFVNFLDSRHSEEKPFFSFIFFDLAHGMRFPQGMQKKFKPSWDFPDYSKLHNKMDPTPFWNLYLNCTNKVDSLVGIVISNIEKRGLLKNSYVIITGDHGQEFNENKKNYWGHGSNYSTVQLHVPFILHRPETVKPEVNKYRTTHYDVSSTLLHDVLGVKNDPSDYGMGKLLSDSTFRNWHLVGDNLDFAFIIENNVIVEKKPTGFLDVYDDHMNLKKDYKLKSKELNTAITNINKFYK